MIYALLSQFFSSLRFTHFFRKIFWTGEQTLQTFSLFGCMIFMYIFLKASNVEQHGLFLNTSADHLRLFELTKSRSAKANQNSKGVLIAHKCVTKVCIVLFWMCRGTKKHIFPLLLWSSQSDEICKIIRTRVKPLFVNVLLEQWIWTFDDWRIICANMPYDTLVLRVGWAESQSVTCGMLAVSSIGPACLLISRIGADRRPHLSILKNISASWVNTRVANKFEVQVMLEH